MRRRGRTMPIGGQFFISNFSSSNSFRRTFKVSILLQSKIKSLSRDWKSSRNLSRSKDRLKSTPRDANRCKHNRTRGEKFKWCFETMPISYLIIRSKLKDLLPHRWLEKHQETISSWAHRVLGHPHPTCKHSIKQWTMTQQDRELLHLYQVKEAWETVM